MCQMKLCRMSQSTFFAFLCYQYSFKEGSRNVSVVYTHSSLCCFSTGLLKELYELGSIMKQVFKMTKLYSATPRLPIRHATMLFSVI